VAAGAFRTPLPEALFSKQANYGLLRDSWQFSRTLLQNTENTILTQLNRIKKLDHRKCGKII
jgi:hypothetical protein